MQWSDDAFNAVRCVKGVLIASSQLPAKSSR